MIKLPRVRIPPLGWPTLPLFSSVRGRIIVSFGLLVLIGVTSGTVTIWLMRAHHSEMAAMDSHATTGEMLADAEVNVTRAAALLQRYVIAGDETLVPEIRSSLATASDSLAEARVHEEIRGIDDEEELASLDEIIAGAAFLSESTEHVSELHRSGDAAGAAAAGGEALLIIAQVQEDITEATEHEWQEVEALRSRADMTSRMALLVIYISGAIATVLGLVIAFVMSRSILRPIVLLESAALAVAEGDMKARAPVSGPREVARLGTFINQMIDSLLERTEALRVSEERYRTSVENMLDCFGIYSAVRDQSGHIVDFLVEYVNEAACRNNLMPKEQQIGKRLLELLPAHQETGLFDDYSRLVDTGEPLAKEQLVYEDVYGSQHLSRAFDVRAVKLGDGFAAAWRDVTERKRTEEALRDSEARSRAIVDTAIDGIITCNERGIIESFNPAAERIFGYEAHEVVGRRVSTLMPSPHRKEHDGYVANYLRAGETKMTGIRREVVGQRKDGSTFPMDLAVSEVRLDSQRMFTGVMRDITERKRAEETIRHLAYHDTVTDLPNRVLFRDRLTLALAQARRKKDMLAVMFLDLDRFKLVNDTVGHTVGDKLLQSAAERLSGLLREGDTVARVGGDEFTILLSEISQVEDAVEVAERSLEGFRRPWVLDGHEFHVTTSIGIAMYPSDGEDAETLLRNADTAMYRAKEEGRDNYQLYTPAMNAQIAERLILENDLRHALEREEFVVHYQPQVNINTGRVVGMEALVRWQHPGRGLVSPVEFIPVAEETGLIVPLGEWVLRTACAQNKAWQEAGVPPMRMAVNLSARQFQARYLVETVTKILEETGLDPHCLQLEITEGVAMQDGEFTATMLRDLQEMGVQIALDDFGTGHSSLNYLARFPIDALKIDRSFVRDLPMDESAVAITTAIISLAHSLNLYVIAEGVETKEQLAFLKKQKCDDYQGYLFSKPWPAEVSEARGERQLLRRNPYGLTFRELTVLNLVATGKSARKIGSELGISPLTVQKHLSNIFTKMDATSRTEAVARGLREGLLD